MMTDSKIELGRCTRCGTYCFLAEVAGMQAVTDMEPLSLDGATKAVTAGSTLYVLVSLDGVPHRLHVALKADLRAFGAAMGDQEGPTLVADHEHRGAVRPVRAPAAPPAAPCPSGPPQGREAASQGASRGPGAATAEPANAATRRPTSGSEASAVDPASPDRDEIIGVGDLTELLQHARDLEERP